MDMTWRKFQGFVCGKILLRHEAAIFCECARKLPRDFAFIKIAHGVLGCEPPKHARKVRVSQRIVFGKIDSLRRRIAFELLLARTDGVRELLGNREAVFGQLDRWFYHRLKRPCAETV